MNKTIYIDGLEIEVTKKRIKRMNMRIKEPDGRIVISAPYGTPAGDITAFVRSKRNWIDKSVRSVRERSAAHPEAESKAEKEAKAVKCTFSDNKAPKGKDRIKASCDRRGNRP